MEIIGGNMVKHLLDIDDLSIDEVNQVLDFALNPDESKPLKDKGVALIFQKPSLRTRNSMEMAVVQLGGHPVYIQDMEVGIDSRESIEDVVMSMAQYHEIICARVFDHLVLERMASVDVAPIVNLLSDSSHPMQALADLLTMKQEFGDLKNKRVAYIGDPNNVARSLAIIAKMFGMEFTIATPNEYRFSEDDCRVIDKYGGIDLTTDDPKIAAKNADVLYTDVWVSMGDEEESDIRKRMFDGYCIDSQLMSVANENAIVMHCLPAHRGQEITDEVMRSTQSRIFLQAQNRMHSARGLLRLLGV